MFKQLNTGSKNPCDVMKSKSECLEHLQHIPGGGSYQTRRDLRTVSVDVGYILLSFLGRKFPRFWDVPTFGAWIWQYFSLWAKSWFLSPSSPMSSLTTWSQPAKCLWWWRCLRLWGFRAPSTSPWPLNKHNGWNYESVKGWPIHQRQADSLVMGKGRGGSWAH